MDFEQVHSEVRLFWVEERYPFEGGGESRLSTLQADYGGSFPRDLQTYIGHFLSPDRFLFESVGNAIDVYGFDDLSRRLDGYNYNPLTNEDLDDWSDSWFLLADEGADPIIIDLVEGRGTPRVLQALHGQGSWDFDVLAFSLPQFALLVAARHYALQMVGPAELIADDERGFNLNLARPSGSSLGSSAGRLRSMNRGLLLLTMRSRARVSSGKKASAAGH